MHASAVFVGRLLPGAQRLWARISNRGRRVATQARSPSRPHAASRGASWGSRANNMLRSTVQANAEFPVIEIYWRYQAMSGLMAPKSAIAATPTQTAAVRPSAIFISKRNGIPLVTFYMGVVTDREGGDDRWRQHRKGNALVQHRATLSS